MLETPHVIVGAAIAAKIPNPYIAIPAAFLSHFVLERVPHWNPHLNTELKKYGKITNKSLKVIIVDSFLALGIGSFIAYQALPDTAHALTILASCFAATLPDTLEIPYFFFKNKNNFFRNWIKFQKTLQVDTSPLPGLSTQFVTSLAALYWIFFS